MAFARLNIICRERGPHEVATRLRDLTDWIADDMLGFEVEEVYPCSAETSHT